MINICILSKMFVLGNVGGSGGPAASVAGKGEGGRWRGRVGWRRCGVGTPHRLRAPVHPFVGQRRVSPPGCSRHWQGTLQQLLRYHSYPLPHSSSSSIASPSHASSWSVQVTLGAPKALPTLSFQVLSKVTPAEKGTYTANHTTLSPLVRGELFSRPLLTWRVAGDTGVLEPSLLEFSADIIKDEIKERVRVSLPLKGPFGWSQWRWAHLV
jgi:hypothetical protein